MSDEIKPEVIKKTQELLGKYFKAPPLTEKLLKKPPFRFLHDIISAVIRETGFLEGLFSEQELNSDNVKDKESKVAYLTKLIEVVKLATGDNLTVRPSKIVAGQEPAKTNELLQSIGKALDKKINSKDAIEQYKKGKSKAKSEKDDKKSRKSQHKKDGSPREKKIANAEKEKNTAKPDASEEKENKKKDEKSHENAVVEQKTEKASSKTRKPVPSAKVDSDNAMKSSKPPRKKSLTETSDSAKRPSSTKESSALKKKKPVKLQNSDSIPENQVVESKSEPKISSLESEKPPQDSPKPTPMETDTKGNKELEKKEEKVPEVPVSEPIEPVKPTEISTPSEIVRPRTSLRPPSARPPSARPAAPRMRAKTDFVINEEIMTPAGNVSVIVENFDTKEDNAEDMVVMEAPRDPMQMQNVDKLDAQFSQEHGHLVAQILETQKELINTDNADVLPKKVEIEWEAGSRRDREATVKEVDKLRSTIQTLTRATNPLRKLLDFVQEDVEIMQKELRDWQFQYEEFSKELEIEQTRTEQSIEPMKESLEELTNNIKMQINKIGQVKMNIMKNDQKIQRLLNGNF